MDASNWMGLAVEVVKGRKVRVGTTGEVKWAKEGKWGWRVGLRVAGKSGLVFVAAKNCQPLDEQAAQPDRFVEDPGLVVQHEPQNFNFEDKAPVVVHFECPAESYDLHVVAFDDFGLKMTHRHRCANVEEARKLAAKVRASRKSFEELRSSTHWDSGDAEYEMVKEEMHAMSEAMNENASQGAN